MSLSLYVHIPFCIQRCIYCDFVSGIYTRENADRYIQALKKEMGRIPNNVPFSTLYIGGGTPTALHTDRLRDLLRYIFHHFTFRKNYEATIEANPGTLDSKKLDVLSSSGLNRISIGVQSFHDSELSFLGRIHTVNQAEQAVLLSKRAGFQNIGIDLLYGLPGQETRSWKMTLEKTAVLKPHHISTYELTVEKGTALDYYLKNPSFPLSERKETPDEDVIEMYTHTIDYLQSRGYEHYEISNFALPDYYSRHNINYWERGDYYGAGLGAHSFVKGKRYYNTDNIEHYLGLVSENRSPVLKSETISEDEAVSEAIFLGLRKTDGLNVESFSRRYNRNILSCYQKEIKALLEAGLIQITSSHCSYETTIKLTRKGLSLSNEVFEKFI